MTDARESGGETKWSVGELFHVTGTSSDDRSGINGRDCSLPPSAAPDNISDLDVDMVCEKIDAVF